MLKNNQCVLDSVTKIIYNSGIYHKEIVISELNL